MANNKLKEQSDKEYDETVRRLAKEHVAKGGNKGLIFLRPAAENPLVKAANEVFQKARNRTVQ